MVSYSAEMARETPENRFRLRHFIPLVGFVVPTVVIGYGVVIPRSCIAGWNELTVGFGATVVGACLTYLAGLRLAAARSGDGEV